jgi:hypothetical protein
MRFHPVTLLLLGCLLALPNVGAADTESAAVVPEARIVKAAYVYNFTKFVEWATEDGAADRAATVVVCVVGTDPVGSALDEIAALQSKGRPILVRHLAGTEEIPACHILYIGRSEEERFARILAQVGKAGVLTVSDIPRFTEHGGMIGFVADRGRVRVEIDAVRIRAAGLRVSSKLLEVARVVRRESS